MTNVLPMISVTKVPSPASRPEPGGLFTFTYVVTNNSVETVTLTSVNDSVIGDITLPAVLTLAPGASSAPMTGTKTYTESGVYPNTVTAKAVDNEKNEATATASASVTVTDVLPKISVTKVADPTSRLEPGGLFTFTYVVTNNSVETVTLTSVHDSVIGDITLPADVTLSPGESTLVMTGSWTYAEPGVYPNTVTAKAVDNEKNEATATADASVTVTDVLPLISVTKVADPSSRLEPGGLFTFTYVVTNNSVETVTLTSVNDSVIGDITLPAVLTLAPGASSAPMTGTKTYTESGVYPNTVTAKAIDNEKHEAVATASASVTVTDVLPTISVTKIADPSSRLEPGGLFTFTYVVTNNSVETVTLTSVHDSVIGDITLPEVLTLAPGASSAPMTGSWTYTEPGTYPNTVTAKAIDNEENEATSEASTSVTVEAIHPAIVVEKTSNAPEEGVLAGTSVTYSFKVTNTGDTTLYNVTVVDDKLGEIGTIEELGVEDSETLTKTFVLNETTTNVVTATGHDQAGHVVSDTDELTVETFLPFNPPDVALAKEADVETADPGDIITYTLTYTNIGKGSAEDFTITDDYDERYVSVVDAAGGDDDGSEITWAIDGPLAPGASGTITYTVRVSDYMPDGTTIVRNTAVATVPGDSDTSNNTATETVSVTVEEFLPFTGGEFTLLLLIAFFAIVVGAALRRFGREEL